MFDMKTKASTAIARGDACKISAGTAAVLTAGAKCLGVSQGVKAVADTATTKKSFIEVGAGRVRWLAWEKRATGSLAATDLKSLVDMSGATGAMGFDSSAGGNDDLYLDIVEAVGASNTGRARVIFGDPSWHHATN